MIMVSSGRAYRLASIRLFILFISQREAASEFCPASHSVNRRIVSFSLKMPKISAVWDYFDETDNREKIRRKIGNCKAVLIVGESRSTYNPDPEKSDPARTLSVRQTSGSAHR